MLGIGYFGIFNIAGLSTKEWPPLGLRNGIIMNALLAGEVDFPKFPTKIYPQEEDKTAKMVVFSCYNQASYPDFGGILTIITRFSH